MGAVGAAVVVKPWCCDVSSSCVRPTVIIVGDSGAVGGVGPVEEVIEMFSFDVGEFVNRQVGIWGFVRELMDDPFQCTSAVVVRIAKDTMVPVAEVVFLLVEDM